MKLKTLKDLETFERNTSGLINRKIVYSKDVKQEAIKDYKAIQEKKKKWNRQDVLNYIQWKNNITEEDLNEEKAKIVYNNWEKKDLVQEGSE